MAAEVLRAMRVGAVSARAVVDVAAAAPSGTVVCAESAKVALDVAAAVPRGIWVGA